MSDITNPGGRLTTLDGLRGIAVMGILLINIPLFALIEAAMFNPLAQGGDRPVDIAAWAVNFVLAEGKMRNLFSLLFGASLLLVVQRATAAGENPARVHYARMFWLAVFGAAHLYLIWWGDILLHYAIVGSVAFLFRNALPRTLVVTAILLLVIELLLGFGSTAAMSAARVAASAPDASAALVRTWADFNNVMGIPDAATVARNDALYRSGWTTIVGHRITEGADTLLVLIVLGFETLGMMLLGMAGLKSGFLTGEWPRAQYRRIAAIGYAIGLPVMIALATWLIVDRFDPVLSFAVTTALSAIVRPLIMFAHASVIILWLTGGTSALRDHVIATGRMAFSNYLGTSLLMTTLFYGWGGGLYGSLGRADLYVVVPVVWALMLLWSKPWLDHFRYGPLEWLWRSLSRGKLQPMKK
ncbi:MAG: DUF418 domain-containing protein [Sphingomonadales bacterium]